MLASYGLAEVVARGRGGAGVAVATLQVDAVSPAALGLVGRCYGLAVPPVRTVAAGISDGDAFSGAVDESALDVAALAYTAPRLARVDAFRFDPRASIVVPIVAAVAASSAPGGAAVLSTSVGVCERDLAADETAMAEWALAAAAAQGVTVLASSGDRGSSACAPGDTGRAGQYPATSPFVTAVGGTSPVGPDPTAPFREETVWNEAPLRDAAAGGVPTSRLPRPAYQRSLAVPGDGRAVPDVALVAAPELFGALPVCTAGGGCRMRRLGGTSAEAAGMAGAVADLAAALGTAGRPARLGLLNPLLYLLAADPSAAAAVLHDVAAGGNDLYGTGCCSAGPGYDPASGLGSLDFAALERELAARHG